jgi:hypothetical protein
MGVAEEEVVGMVCGEAKQLRVRVAMTDGDPEFGQGDQSPRSSEVRPMRSIACRKPWRLKSQFPKAK